MFYPVADAHCDFLYGAYNSGYDLREPEKHQNITLETLQAGHVAMQFFACWVDMGMSTPPTHQVLGMVDAYYRMLERNPELVPLTRDFDPSGGKICAVLSMEGGEGIGGDPSVLRMFYRLGIRAATLTWNEDNELCGAAMGRRAHGLTRQGKRIIDEMEEIGMAIDVAHASDHAIDDILSRTERPVFASHSNARAVFHAKRSLKDEFIREIARRGGVIGINFYNKQLGPSPTACIRDIVPHILHVIEVGGIGACCIGSDFDGMPRYPKDLQSSKDFPALFEALEREGLSEEQILRVSYRNLADYILQFA